MGARSRALATRPLLVATSVMMFGFTSAFFSAAQPAATTSLALFDDDSGRSMFPDAEKRAPGARLAQCIDLGARAVNSTDTVTVAACAVSGPLATDLTTRVEIGMGGRFGDCSGFVPQATLYDGPLSGLGSGGVATGWFPGTAPRRSFRVTMGLARSSVQQNRRSSGDFVWSLLSGGSTPPIPSVTPTSTQPPTTGPPSTPQPSPSRSDELGGWIGATNAPGMTGGGRHPGPGAPTDQGPRQQSATDPAPASPRSTPSGGAGNSGLSDQRAGAAGDPDLTLGGGFGSGLAATAKRAAKALQAVVTSPQYPLLAFGLALGFLIIQDRIDRRDPKLALANRSQRDNEVDFPDIFFRGAR